MVGANISFLLSFPELLRGSQLRCHAVVQDGAEGPPAGEGVLVGAGEPAKAGELEV